VGKYGGRYLTRTSDLCDVNGYAEAKWSNKFQPFPTFPVLPARPD
jgi:hypothetical protein